MAPRDFFEAICSSPPGENPQTFAVATLNPTDRKNFAGTVLLNTKTTQPSGWWVIVGEVIFEHFQTQTGRLEAVAANFVTVHRVSDLHAGEARGVGGEVFHLASAETNGRVPEFIERDAFDDFVGRMPNGNTGGLMNIGGPAKSGKTRLAVELLQVTDPDATVYLVRRNVASAVGGLAQTLQSQTWRPPELVLKPFVDRRCPRIRRHVDHVRDTSDTDRSVSGAVNVASMALPGRTHRRRRWGC